MRFLKLALAFAGVLAAKVCAALIDVSCRNVSGDTANTDAAMIECGFYLKVEEEGDMPLYANGHYENLDLFTHMVGIVVKTCGICMVFAGRDAQGDILWSGGPGQDSGGKAKGAQSYYCLSGKENPMDLPAGIKTIEVRATPPRAPAIACGQYFNTAQQGPFDLLANGAWENLAPGTGMSSIRVDSCGICMVFKDRNAQGDTVWSGGPGQTASGSVKDAQSYYCIYGEDSILPREDLPTTTPPSGPLSAIPIQPNPTIPPRAPQFPCGSLGTVTKDGKMDYLPTYSDVQYYVPEDSEITWFENEYCAMCAVFKSREEDAEMIWNDWSDEGARGNVTIKGGRSYFCFGQ